MFELNLLLSNTANFVTESAVGLNLNPQALLHNTLSWIQNLGIVGALAFISIYIIATISFVPGSILTVGAGVVFGVTWGSIYVFVGALLGETLAFLLGRYVARDWIKGKIEGNETFIALDRALNGEGLKIILLTRLSPIFPFSLLNYALGVTGISLQDYLLGSIGMIPMTITYVYLGSLAGDLGTIDNATQFASPQLQWTLRIVGSIATVGVTVFVTRIARQALKESLTSNV